MTSQPKKREYHGHGLTLAIMNRAPHTARRNTAFGRAVQALREMRTLELPSDREHYCLFALEMVDHAIKSSRRLGVGSDGPVVHILKLIRETIQTEIAIIRSLLGLQEETTELKNLLGNRNQDYLVNARTFIERSETEIHESTEALLWFARRILREDTKHHRKDFSPEVLHRYRRTINETREFYKRKFIEVRRGGK